MTHIKELCERLRRMQTVHEARIPVNPDGPAAADALEAMGRERDEAVRLLVGFVGCEDDAKANPMGGLSLGGLMDARDNTGVVYQSAHLANLIVSARQARQQGGDA